MKSKIAFYALIASLILIVVVILFGLTSSKKNSGPATSAAFEDHYDDDYVYHVNEKITVDFYEPILEQFNKESQLVVSSADASIDLNLKQAGVLDVGFLNKSQKITYKGTGRFFIDLSQMSKESISVDDENKTITIFVPHAEMLPLEIDPNKFESEDAKKGLLAFGDLKFTPQEFNDLEIECKTKITKIIDTKENRIKADENAIEEITKIYDPIVQAIDDTYSISVEFSNESNPTK